MNSALRLRSLTREDLAFADSLRALAGWNQTLADWERFVALEPDGCFLAEWQGVSAGTATTTVYGPELAWIGMVLVHPEYRRRGIGRALFERCIDYLSGRGVRCIKLDATPEGKRVYASLGFKDEWTLTRWERAAAHSRPPARSLRIRSWQEADARAVEEIDSAAFGVSRSRIVQSLAKLSRLALVSESESRRIAGYGLLRVGSRALYLGPVAGACSDMALELVEALLQPTDNEKVFWDIPDQNVAAVTWAEQHGFTAQRPLIRMDLGENIASGDPEKQFAIAGPELG